jgi:hypothetical protein
MMNLIRMCISITFHIPDTYVVEADSTVSQRCSEGNDIKVSSNYIEWTETVSNIAGADVLTKTYSNNKLVTQSL